MSTNAVAGKAIQLYCEGHSSLEAARALGVSKTWVLRRVRAAGIVRPLKDAFSISTTHGNALRKSGPDSLSWKGGRKMHSAGYWQVMTKGHPAADRFGYVFEHRLVIEAALGRYLERGEDVHHGNGVKTDNRIENLSLCLRSEHMAIHAATRPRHEEGHFGTNSRRKKCQQQ